MRWSCEGLVMVRPVSGSDSWLDKNRSRCHGGLLSTVQHLEVLNTVLHLEVLNTVQHLELLNNVLHLEVLSTVLHPEKQLNQMPHTFMPERKPMHASFQDAS